MIDVEAKGERLSLGFFPKLILAAFPLVLTVLFVAGADAFYCDKQPFGALSVGFLLGLAIALSLNALLPMIRRAGMNIFFIIILISIALFDIFAIPMARWLI